MLKAIQDFFREHIDPGAGGGTPAGDEHAVTLATVALLVEMTQADFDVAEVEQAEVVDSVRRLFELPDEEMDALLELAEQEVREGVSLHQFTSLINSAFDRGQKIRVVEMMWRVAYADGRVDKYEEHLVRKVADLLYVPHSAFIQARHRVEADLSADK